MVKKLHAFISLISFSLCITILFIFSLLHVKFYHIFYFLSLYMQFYTILELWQNLKLYVRLTLALQLAKIIKTKSHWFQWESHFSFLLQTQIHLLLYIHSIYFIRYTLLVRLWTLLCCQNCLNSLWHSFNKGLETFLRYSGLYPHGSITKLLQIWQLLKLISCSTTSQKAFWIILVIVEVFEQTELIGIFKKPV